MKKTLLFVSIPLLLIFNACTSNNLKQSLSPKITVKPLLITQEEESVGGGNPEVYIAHNCLKSKSAKSCFNELFSDKRKVYLASYESIKLAGRGTSVEKATIMINDDDLFMLYLDTSKVKTPLSSNISQSKVSTDKDSALFIFPVKKIHQEIILKDKDGEIVLQYKVLKRRE